MKNLIKILFFLCLAVNAQLTKNDLPIALTDSLNLDADRFIGVDVFKNIYYTNNNILYKKTVDTILSHSSISFGEMTAVDIKNPLKILVFYRDHNAVSLLDSNLNILGESKLFNRHNINLNVVFAQLSGDNKIWVYSKNDSRLHLYDYQLDEMVESSQPVYFYQNKFVPDGMISTYKNCWLVNKDYALQFDEYGYFKKRIGLDGMRALNMFNNQFYWIKDGFLFRSDLITEMYKLVPKKSVTNQSYYVLNDEIYIFNGKKVFIFK